MKKQMVIPAIIIAVIVQAFYMYYMTFEVFHLFPKTWETRQVTFISFDTDYILYLDVDKDGLVEEPYVEYPGHVFLGWYTRYDSPVPINQWHFYEDVVTEDTKLYAVWRPIEYTIYLHDSPTDIYDTIDAPVGYEVELPSPQKAGYVFEGWYKDLDFIERVPLTGNMPVNGLDLYAKWVSSEYTMDFYDMEGNLFHQIDIGYGHRTEEYQMPTAPIEEGYTFIEWDTEIPYIMPAETISFHPIYQINTYSITYFDLEGYPLLRIELDYNTDLSFISHPTPPSITGYTFSHWSFELPDTMPDSNLILRPIYEPNQ